MSDFQERRQDNLNLQGTLLKLVAKFDSMENNLEIRLQSFDDKLSNLENKFQNILDLKSSQIGNIEERLKEHEGCLDEAEKTITLIQTYKAKILDLQDRVDGFDKRISVLETAPIKIKAAWIDDLFGVVRNAIYLLIAGGIVTATVYLVKMIQ